MTGSIKKQTTKVIALSSSLDELERKLEPLLSRPLSDTLNSLDTLQQAKLQVLLPYLINDLIFIHLKTRGIDPKTHPVVTELERVKQYFGKVKDAEECNKKRTSEIDKAAANRFIKHAISEARRSVSNVETKAVENEAGPSNSQCSAPVPARVTQKMKDREEYLRRVAEESDSEEPELQIIDAADGNEREELKGKGKEVARRETVVMQEASVEVTSESSSVKKRKRAMDPFGSYGEDAAAVPESDKKQKKKKKAKVVTVVDEASANSRATSDADTSKNASVSKKKKKKKAKNNAAEEGPP